ncbi:MAG: EamA family transporter [Brachybacterium sp.]|nr:EamA family transporter [Brachybacterium sp.]
MSTAEGSPGGAPAGSDAPDRRGAAGVALVATGAASTQVGASFAALALPGLGIPAVVAIRQLVMALIHLPFAATDLRRAPRRHLWWGVLVAVPLITMNLAIYGAIREMGVGLAVTIEFLGPLALSVLAARSRIGWLCAVVGFLGMLCVTGPAGTATLLGTAYGLLSAAGWAAYLAASKAAGIRLGGLAPSAVAAATSAVVLTPIALLTLDLDRVTWTLLGLAVLAGVLSSALPYATDVLALRRLPLSVVSTLMSMHPACAALAGAVILSERLGAVDIIGLVLISVANAVAVRAARRPPRPPSLAGQEPGMAHRPTAPEQWG